MRCTYLNQASLCALMKFIIFLFPINRFSSSFDIILHVPYLTLVGP
jgi:hypothetical protein